MKSQSPTQQPLRRFAAVLVVIAALAVVALAPALLASQLITPDWGKSTATGHIDHAATTDVTNIDPEATVMYTVSPSDGDSDIEIIVSADMVDVLQDGDMIKMTVIDQGTDKRTDSNSYSFVDPQIEDGCRITLNLRSDDRFGRPTGTYSGYLRIKDDDSFTATYADHEQQENCGLYFIYAD